MSNLLLNVGKIVLYLVLLILVLLVSVRMTKNYPNMFKYVVLLFGIASLFGLYNVLDLFNNKLVDKSQLSVFSDKCKMNRTVTKVPGDDTDTSEYCSYEYNIESGKTHHCLEDAATVSGTLTMLSISLVVLFVYLMLIFVMSLVSQKELYIFGLDANVIRSFYLFMTALFAFLALFIYGKIVDIQNVKLVDGENIITKKCVEIDQARYLITVSVYVMFVVCLLGMYTVLDFDELDF